MPEFNKFKKYFKRRPAIQDILRETTAGGIVFRRDKNGKVEILLAQDAKDRWTIAKGHILNPVKHRVKLHKEKLLKKPDSKK